MLCRECGKHQKYAHFELVPILPNEVKNESTDNEVKVPHKPVTI
jgi:hypothetical protein